MKRTLFLIMFLAVMLGMFTSLAADEITIGTGTSYTYEPIASFYGYHRSAAIYTSGEIGGSGSITTISYRAYNTNSTTIPVKVYMKMTTASSLSPATSWPNLISGLTPLYEGSHSGTTAGAWKTITLTTPFQFTGNNLMILIESNYGGGGTTGPQWYYSAATNRNQYIRKDNSAPTTETGTVNSNRPNVRLNIDGYAVFAPEFSVNPTSVDFSVVSINTTTAYTNVTVSNSGAGTLNISSVMLGGSDPGSFILDMNSNPTPWALTAGQSKIVKVAFNPTEERSYSAYLRFAGDARVDHDVSLSGTGIDPTIDEFPYENGFENGGALPAGWTVTAGTGATTNWQCVTSDASNGASGPQAGTYFARLNVYNAQTAYNPYSLVTPPIDLSSGNKRISFYAWIGSAAAASPLDVEISMDNKETWTTLISFNNTSNTNAWYQTILSLAAYPSSSAYIRFKGTSNYGYGSCNLGLDSIVIDDLPANASFAVNPTTWNFGQVDLAVPPVTKQFTISNSGGAPLVLSSIDVTEGADVFTITVGPDMTINPGGSTTFTVQFSPLEATTYEGNIKINDNTDDEKGSHNIPLFGEGYTRPAGSTCDNPYDVTLPLVGFIGDTSLYGDDYESTWVTPNSYYLGGDDMVLRFTIAQASTLSGTLTATTGSYIGMLFTQAIPNPTTPAPLLGSATSSGTVATLTGLELAAGTYYLILSTWPSPQSFQFSLNLSATPIVSDPVFEITPNPGDFGTTQLNSPVPMNFTIKNTGGGTLFIDKDDVTISGADQGMFVLTPIADDISLGRNQTAVITVTFLPTSEGVKNAALNIIDNTVGSKASLKDSGKATQTVQLTGEGVDATISQIPYIQTWSVPALITGWGVFDLNADAITWGLYSDSGNTVAGISYNVSAAMNDWLISPPIILNAGTTYTVTYRYRAAGSSFPEKMKVVFGNAQNPTAMTQVIADHVNFTNTSYVTNSADFTPETKGTWYLGFHGYSAADMYNIYLDDIRILLPNTQVGQVVATGATASVTLPAITVGEEQISPQVSFSGLSGNPVIQVSASYGVTGDPLTSERLVLTIDGGDLSGVTVTFTHGLGFIPPVLAYQIGGSGTMLVYNPGDWTETVAYFTVPAGKGPQTLKTIFPKDINDTLPVELSSFTAILTADMFVQIAWVAQSETSHLGYNILRGESTIVNDAVKINPSIINEGTALGTQMSYNYADTEVESGYTYYYWLESVDLGGMSVLHGPLSVVVTGDPNDPGTPELPTVTKLMNAFPNPFNPSTTLRYSLKEAGKVRIEIYNMKGQMVRSYNNEHATPGYYQVSWDGKDAMGRQVASGVYMYRMSSGRYHATKRMVLAK